MNKRVWEIIVDTIQRAAGTMIGNGIIRDQAIEEIESEIKRAMGEDKKTYEGSFEYKGMMLPDEHAGYNARAKDFWIAWRGEK